jgi:hypothetical protein
LTAGVELKVDPASVYELSSFVFVHL